MIGKVIRGANVRGLLYYLYGPGRANEHTNPHLVAGFSDPAELEPERLPSGSPDLRRLAGLMTQPVQHRYLLPFRDLLTISPGPWHPLEADGHRLAGPRSSARHGCIAAAGPSSAHGPFS